MIAVCRLHRSLLHHGRSRGLAVCAATRIARAPKRGRNDLPPVGVPPPLDSDVTVAGTVSKLQMESIANSRKFKTWLYLCTNEGRDVGMDEEGLPAVERAALDESRGLELLHFPVNLDALKVSEARIIFDAISSAPSPMLVSCNTALRAHAMKLVYEAMLEGESSEDALERARKGKAKGILKHKRVVHWVSGAIESILRPPGSLIFRQLSCGDTLSYLLACTNEKQAIIIDPVDAFVERDLKLLEELGLELRYTLSTHLPRDFASGAPKLVERAKGGTMHVISEASGVKSVWPVDEGDKLYFGDWFVEVLRTPGVSKGCMSYVTSDRAFVFTGNTLLPRGCGVIDERDGGSAQELYESVHEKLFMLPEDTCVMPCRVLAANGMLSSTIEEERAHNKLLNVGDATQFAARVAKVDGDETARERHAEENKVGMESLLIYEDEFEQSDDKMK